MTQQKFRNRCCKLAVLWLFSGAVLADSKSDDGAVVIEQNWAENLRWTIDSSTQQWTNLDSDQWMDQYVIGLDVHKVVSSSQRDIGTLVLQPYMVWLPSERPRPAFFDGNEAALTWRIANFNFIARPRGRLNIRIGHFEIPFGLEHEINTNGTLRQYSNTANLGAKADWGIGINGHLPKWQYEVGLTRGTGQEMHSAGNPYAISARLGTPSNENFAVGISVFQGRMLEPAGLVEKDRIGADMRWSRGPLQFLAEASSGSNANNEVISWLTELNWINRKESSLVYCQYQKQKMTTLSDSHDDGVLALGMRWLFRDRLTLAAEFKQSVSGDSQQSRSNELRLHLRFRL